MSTSNISVSDLSWGQRFALINSFNPTDEQACKVLGVTKQELGTARALISKGVFHVDTTLNVEPYGILFGKISSSKQKIAVSTTGTRRGRKGDKISLAFAAIPLIPTSAEKFVEDYGISMPVLRQFKRFDKTGLPGQVFVRKQDGILKVWRAAEVAPSDVAPDSDAPTESND